MRPPSSTAPSTTALAPDIVLRAIAICMVVFNHASITDSRPVHLGGGLNILLLLSGYAFARFTLSQGDVHEVRRRIVRFALGVWLPCLVVVLLSFVAKREWSWSELLFVSTLFGDEHIALMYVWYPQVLLQLFALLLVLTFVPGVDTAIRQRPALLAVALLVASFSILLLLHGTGEATDLLDRSLQAIAWNFFLGCTLWYARSGSGRLARSSRNVLLGLTLTLSLIAFGVGVDVLRTVALTVSTAVMLFASRIVMPGGLARAAGIVSQATFTVFLCHVLFLRIFDAAGLRQIHHGFDARDTVFAGCFAIAGSLVLWLAGVSLSRAWRHEWGEQPRPHLRMPAAKAQVQAAHS
jgi:hypothetical protein